MLFSDVQFVSEYLLLGWRVQLMKNAQLERHQVLRRRSIQRITLCVTDSDVYRALQLNHQKPLSSGVVVHGVVSTSLRSEQVDVHSLHLTRHRLDESRSRLCTDDAT
jgi:hypothetical protein